MTPRLRLWEIEVQFLSPLVTATGTHTVRRSVIVALDAEGSVGWGEAPAFPSGRAGTAEAAYATLCRPEIWIDGLPPVPIAAAAMQAARADAAARSAGVPLHRHLGASGRPVPARTPLGILDREQAAAEATRLTGRGVRAVKVKVAPDRELEPVGVLREGVPGLDIGVDANGSYRDPGDDRLTALDAMGVSFIEQPFPAEDLDSHAALRRRLQAVVALDESVPDEAAVRRALAAGAAGRVAVKPNRAGLAALRAILDLCSAAGVGVQVGGTFDTAIGRRHLLALATLPGVDDAAVGPPNGYLAADLAPYPDAVDGAVAPEEAPGIGIDPDTELLDRTCIRKAEVSLERAALNPPRSAAP